MNNTQDSRFVGLPIEEGTRVLFVVLGCLVCVSGVVGNVVLLTVLTKYKSVVQHLQSVYIVNLSISDLIIEGYFVPFWILDLLIGYHPLFGSGYIHCIFNGWLSCTCYTVSVLLLLLISANRYFCVCHPQLFQRLFGPHQNVVQCCVVWLISALLTLPPVFGVGPYAYDMQAHLCAFDRSRLLTYMNVYAAVFIPMPTVGVGVFNLAIYRRWKTSVQRVGQWSKGGAKPEITATSKDCGRSAEDNERRGKSDSSVCKSVVRRAINRASDNALASERGDKQVSQNSPRLSGITDGDGSSDVEALKTRASERRRSSTNENDSVRINKTSEQSQEFEGSREFRAKENGSPTSTADAKYDISPRTNTPVGVIESGTPDMKNANNKDRFDNHSEERTSHSELERHQQNVKLNTNVPELNSCSPVDPVDIEQSSSSVISDEIPQNDVSQSTRQDSRSSPKMFSVAPINGNNCREEGISLKPVLGRALQYHDKVSILPADVEFSTEGDGLTPDEQNMEARKSVHFLNKSLEKDVTDQGGMNPLMLKPPSAQLRGGWCEHKRVDNASVADVSKENPGERQSSKNATDCQPSNLQNDKYTELQDSDTDNKTDVDTDQCDPLLAEHFVRTKSPLQKQSFQILDITGNEPSQPAEGRGLSDPDTLANVGSVAVYCNETSKQFLHVPEAELEKLEEMPSPSKRKLKACSSNISRIRRKRLNRVNTILSFDADEQRISKNGNESHGTKSPEETHIAPDGAKCFSSGDCIISRVSSGEVHSEKGSASGGCVQDQNSTGRILSGDGPGASTSTSDVPSSGNCDEGEKVGISRSDDGYRKDGVSSIKTVNKLHTLSPAVPSTHSSGGRSGTKRINPSMLTPPSTHLRGGRCEHRRVDQDNTTITNSADQRENASTGVSGTKSKDQKYGRRVRSSDIALVRSLLAVWVCLLVLNTPFLVASYVCTFTGGSAEIFLAMNWLVFLNNSVNWMLYGALNKTFRMAFFKFFTDLSCFSSERRGSAIRIDENRLPANTTGTMLLTEQQGRAATAMSYS